MATLNSISRFILSLTVFAFFHFSVLSLPEKYRWYNTKSNPLKKNSGLKAPFVSLHNSGCCEDRVECKEMDNKKPNYGDRIFKSVNTSAAFQDPNDRTLLIHTLIFGDVLAAHKYIEDTTLNPVFRGLGSLKENYTTNDTLFQTEVGKDCNVRAWMHYKEAHIFVCNHENGVRFLIKTDAEWASENKFIYKPNCLTAMAGHPAMCEDNLIDLLAIPEGNGKTTVVAYIELEGMDVHGKRTIYHKVWEDENENEKGSSAKYESQLASIYWYRLDENIAHGIYFTTDAFVCKFDYERGKGDFDVNRFQFATSEKRDFCRPMSVYLECPQGWCYELGMTTSFTIQGEGNFSYVYFTKGLWHFRVKARKIPMSVPRVEDALYYGSRIQNIWAEGDKYKNIPGEAPYPPIMILDATAAFRIEHKGKVYTFSYNNGWNSVPDGDAKNGSKGLHASNWRDKERNRRNRDWIGNPIPLKLFPDIKPEAAYFDDTERKLYLFEGSQYTVFQVKETAEDIAMNKSWKHLEGPKSVKDLNFEEGDEIKEVIALGDNLNFVINATHFYHSVGKIYESKKELKFSFTELFRVQSECYYNDYREFKKTLDMYGIKLPETTVSQRKYDDQQRQSMGTKSTWGIVVIFIIIAFGAAVALVGLLGMFLFGRVHNRTETKVVKKYITETSGIKDRRLSKEPSSKLRTKKKL